jgi:hypothetical protein
MATDYTQLIGQKFRTKDRKGINAHVIYTVSGANADHNFGMVLGTADAVHLGDKGTISAERFDAEFEPYVPPAPKAPVAPTPSASEPTKEKE